MKKFGYALALSFATPLFALAAGVDDSYLVSILTKGKSLINMLLPIIIALAVLYFIWGLFQLFTTADEEKKDKAKHTIIYGIIALFVMVSVWGIVNLLASTLGISKDSVPTITNLIP